MRCVKPYSGDRGAFPCGQCMPCRLNRRRIWTHRLMLEAADHEASSFVTLTYADAPRDLRPKDIQLWLKRFRFAVQPRRIRYFAVGEYGDRTWRPHYHVALYGWPACLNLNLNRGCRCTSCSVVRETWGFGHVFVATLEESSAAYVCGYVMKKLTTISDPRLEGRVPEFSRMSLKPGIGADAMWHVASEMMRFDAEVPQGLKHARKEWPLGRYLRNRLKEMTGREKGATVQELEVLARELQLVREYAWANDRSVSSVYAELNEGYENKLVAKARQEARQL